ncbi:Hypothetical protein, putative [Bodo saltans]|uniref:NACHT domain-containing protein n=1 Tax=Bodo saltans TaxID=75058 RepID=A0A0S4J1H0_BODSA|nr:Hypothetical protein, putative [Bodo saltans]|eukprot:CUG45236.1 Hypothetical protein, putative [Bodo saltans]
MTHNEKAHLASLSTFQGFGTGAWTVDQWATATEAADAFPEPFKAELLEDCANKVVGLFVLDYARCLNALTEPIENASSRSAVRSAPMLDIGASTPSLPPAAAARNVRTMWQSSDDDDDTAAKPAAKVSVRAAPTAASRNVRTMWQSSDDDDDTAAKPAAKVSVRAAPAAAARNVGVTKDSSDDDDTAAKPAAKVSVRAAPAAASRNVRVTKDSSDDTAAKPGAKVFALSVRATLMAAARKVQSKRDGSDANDGSAAKPLTTTSAAAPTVPERFAFAAAGRKAWAKLPSKIDVEGITAEPAANASASALAPVAPAVAASKARATKALAAKPAAKASAPALALVAPVAPATAAKEVLAKQDSGDDSDTAVAAKDAAKAAVLAAARLVTANADKRQMLTLADAAAAMSARASCTLQGSRVHRLLSEWSGALEAVGGQLAPLLLSTLPFGDLLAAAAAGLFAAVMGRGAVLELGTDLCGQTVLVLRVLVQPPVRETIIADSSTHSLLEELLVTMEEAVRILEDYNGSWAVAQLWSAGSILEKLQQQSAEMHRVFTLMFQLTSFRAHASNANDMHRVLEVVGAMQFLTMDSLCEHLLPQLLERLDNVVAATDAAVRAAKANGTAAVGEMLGSLLRDITTMTTTELDQRFGALEGSTIDAVRSVKDQISSVMSTVVSAASTATVSVLSHTMRSLLDDVVRAALPSMMRDAVSSGLKEHLEGVVNEAWVAALQCEMHDAALLVQAHTGHTVSVATIQLGSQVKTLQRRLELASTAAADAMRTLETTLLERLDQQISGAEEVVQDEARAVRAVVDSAHLSIADKIAVLHIEVTGVLSEVHLQRRILQKMGAKLDSMYEAGGAVLKKQTEITEVLDALPSSIRQALSRDVQRLHQQLRSHQSRTRDFVERLLNDAMSQLMTSYKEHQALQRRQHRETKRYLSQLLQQQNDMQQRQLDDKDERRRQHNEVMEHGGVVLFFFLGDGHHLTVDQRRYFAAYPLPLLQVELRCVYHELHATETSAIAPSIELSRMGMYTSLRIMHAPSAAMYRGDAAESYEGASMESTEVLSTMEAKNWRSLLVEGRAGIGKTTWSIHLAQLQNFLPGVVILLKLSDVAKYLEGRQTQGIVRNGCLSPRELLHISFGDDVGHAALVERLFYKMRTGSSNTSAERIVWLVDGLDEVITNTNPHLKLLLDAVDTAIRGKSGATGIFGPRDMVVVTSREERGGRLSVSQFVATINPWNEVEAKSYINTYFSQPSVREAIGIKCTDDERDARLLSFKEDAVKPISENRFGALSTLPIVLEMLCWCAMEGTSSATDIVSLYKQTVDLKLNSAQTYLRTPQVPWTSSKDDIVSLCMRSSVKTRDSVFFDIDAKEPISYDLLRSGLVREQFGAATAKTSARFIHKSFLEYFRALYFSTNLSQLDSILCDDPVATTPYEGGVEFVVFSSPQDLLCVETPSKYDVDVTLQLQCVRTPTALPSFDVIWLEGEGQKAAYEAALKEWFTSRYWPKNTVTCAWATNKELTKTKTFLLRGKSKNFLVVRPVSGTSILPVRCRWFSTDDCKKPARLSMYNQLPLCDIPGYRQQRNFFLFLCVIVKNSENLRRVLFEYLLRRVQYHHPRVASFMAARDRSISTPLTAKVVVSFAGRSSFERDRRSKAHIVAEMGLSVVTECAALLLHGKADFGSYLKSIIERSSRFGRFTDFLNLRPKAIFDWALLPCARHGTWTMWQSVERHISNESTPHNRQLLEEALVAAVVNGRYDVDQGLVARGVKIDLSLACRLGATELVVRELRKTIGAGDSNFIDDVSVLTLTTSLSTLQMDTAAAVWEELKVVSSDTVKVWRLIFSSFTSLEGESWRVDDTVMLPPVAVSWLRDCFATLISRLSPSQREAAEQCFLSTKDLPYDAIQRAITSHRATFSGLLDGFQHFLTDETILAIASKVTGQKVRRAVISNPSKVLKAAIRERCTFTSAHAIELSDCDVNDFLGALTESTHTLEELRLTNCIDLACLQMTSYVRIKVLALVNCDLVDALVEAIPFFVALEDLTVIDTRRDVLRVRRLLSSVRSTLRSLSVSNVDVDTNDLRGPSFGRLQSLTISNNCKVCDEFIAQLVVNCPLLVHLALPACDRVTDAGVQHIMQLQSLTSTCLRGCSRITNSGVALIASKKRMHSIDLVDCVQITGSATSLFNQFSLDSVDLSGCGKLTDGSTSPTLFISGAGRPCNH